MNKYNSSLVYQMLSSTMHYKLYFGIYSLNITKFSIICFESMLKKYNLVLEFLIPDISGEKFTNAVHAGFTEKLTKIWSRIYVII